VVDFRESTVRSPLWATGLSLVKNVVTGYGTHTEFYVMGTVDSYPGTKAINVPSELLTQFNAEFKKK
jgi:hypothetical protein